MTDVIANHIKQEKLSTPRSNLGYSHFNWPLRLRLTKVDIIFYCRKPRNLYFLYKIYVQKLKKLVVYDKTNRYSSHVLSISRVR